MHRSKPKHRSVRDKDVDLKRATEFLWTIEGESIPPHSRFLRATRDATIQQHHDGSTEIETLPVFTQGQCKILASCATGEHDHNMGRDVENFAIKVLSRAKD